jgi:hypothetical protein
MHANAGQVRFKKKLKIKRGQAKKMAKKIKKINNSRQKTQKGGSDVLS